MVVVSNEKAYGGVVSVEMVVHEPPPAGRRWNATDASPEPSVSLAPAASATVCRRFAPGSPSELVGAPASDLASFVEVAVVQLPALSARRYRYCAHLPDATASGLVAGVQPPYEEHVSLIRSPVRRSSAADEASTSGSGPLFVVTANEPVT